MAESEEKKQHKALPGPIELAKEAWGIYKKRFWIIVGIFFIGLLFSLGVVAVAGILGVATYFSTKAIASNLTNVILGLIILIAFIVIIWLSLLFQASYVVAIRDWKKGIGARDAVRAAKPFIGPLFLAGILSSLLIFGSTFLLVIPGILFNIWFGFFIYAVIIDDKRGLLALHASRELFRGRFWRVLWRCIAVHIPEFVITACISFLAMQGAVDQSVSSLVQFLSIVLVPFYMIYSYVLYTKLKDTSHLPTRVPASAKRVYFIVPLLGVGLFILVAVAAGSTIVKFLQKAPVTPPASQMNTQLSPLDPQYSSEEQSALMIGQILAGLEQYYTDNNTFPARLTDLNDTYVTVDLSALPDAVSYSRTDNGANYKLCFHAETGNNFCLTKDGPVIE